MILILSHKASPLLFIGTDDVFAVASIDVFITGLEDVFITGSEDVCITGSEDVCITGLDDVFITGIDAFVSGLEPLFLFPALTEPAIFLYYIIVKCMSGRYYNNLISCCQGKVVSFDRLSLNNDGKHY